MSTQDTEREAFEKWADSMRYCIHRDESDKYKDYHRATTRFAREGWLSALAWAKHSGRLLAEAPRVTDAMVEAYLEANTRYWREADEQPTPIGKWRAGTAKEATRVSLEAALAAIDSAIQAQ